MTLIGALAAALTASAPDVRICPADMARAYPLADVRGVSSLLLQSFAIRNPTSVDLEVNDVEIRLLSKSAVKDVRVLGPAELAAQARAAPAIEGLSGLLPGQFCNGDEFGGLKLASKPTVGPGQALLVLQQVFAWSGPRDAVQVVAHIRQGGAPATLTTELPVTSTSTRAALRFPLAGYSFIGAGPSFHSGHRWGVFEAFAYDIAKLGPDGLTHRGEGRAFTDYFAYGAPVMAVADGTVVAAVDGVTEDPTAMKRPDETDDAYLGRLMGEQDSRLAKGDNAIVGNHVIIDHGGGEFSVYAHLQPGSVIVKAGQKITVGGQIGRLGSSGNSTEPHLHFQVCDRAQPLGCNAIPAQFTDVELPLDPGARALQTGDLVRKK